MNSSERFPRRATAARATRRRVIVTASALFEERGYTATSIMAIAEAAGVAEQTIYAAFGNKRTLLAEAVDQAIAGDDERVVVNDRDWMRAVLDDPNATSALRDYGRAVSKIHERAARIFHVLEVAAAGTPELRELAQETLDRRRTGAAAVIGPMAERGDLRRDLKLDEAIDVVWAMNGPDMYLNLVDKRHWTCERYGAWLGDAFVALLLVDCGTTLGDR